MLRLVQELHGALLMEPARLRELVFNSIRYEMGDTLAAITRQVGLKPWQDRRVDRALQVLRRRGLITYAGKRWRLTEAGRRAVLVGEPGRTSQ